MAQTKEAPAKAALSFTITKVFDAAPKDVFEAWLDPESMAIWLGCHAMRARFVKLESHKGGKYVMRMTAPKGEIQESDPTLWGEYREITRYTRLSFTWNWADAAGGVNPLSAGQETLVTLKFRPVGKQTELTLTHENFTTAEACDQHAVGWTASFDQLAEELAGE